MESSERFKIALEKVEIKKQALNIALENYTEAKEENLEKLKKNSDKAFEELKEEYLLLIDELIRQIKT